MTSIILHVGNKRFIVEAEPGRVQATIISLTGPSRSWVNAVEWDDTRKVAVVQLCRVDYITTLEVSDESE